MSDLFSPTRDAASMCLAQVVPERAMDRFPDGLTYEVPVEMQGLVVGERVVVPLGRGSRPAPGFVIEINVQTEMKIASIKPITRRDTTGGSLTRELLELARWMAAYYCCPLGTVLGALLPAAVKKGTGRVTRSMVDLAPDIETAITKGGDLPRLSSLQKSILDTLHQSDTRPIEMRNLAQLAGAKTSQPVKRLIEQGILTVEKQSGVRALWEEHVIEAAKRFDLMPSQRAIVDTIGPDLGHGFGVDVIYGVTGSGKTEVYLHLIEQVIAQGKAAIVLVPEISLTPQTAGRFLARFGDRVAILHSGLTAAQRHHQWKLVQEEKADVVVGARSAVFAPIADERLGLIVVDEEHDGSYKQDQAPRYQARDVAVKRAQVAGARVILGSATPSLETYYNALERGVYRWHEMRERVPGAQLPYVEIVNMAEAQRKRSPDQKRHVHLLSPRLEGMLHDVLHQGGQAILLLNRRGFANYIACPAQTCGWVMTCPHCDAAMVYHKDASLPKGGMVRCHHCLAEMRLPQSCPDCARKVVTFGMGTQRIEAELERKFPGLSESGGLLRMDADTMHRAADYYAALERFRLGEARVLVGTQMIAKGLDFPNVRLVGVINADTSLSMPDFRAEERTFQLVSQVSGRCGRGEHAGHVIVQTFNPEISAIRLAAAHDYYSFAKVELGARKAAGLPPVGRMARIVVRDRDFAACVRRSKEIAEALHRIIPQIEDGNGHRPPQERLRIRGPAPCPLSRVADHHRYGIEIMAAGPTPIQAILTALRNEGLAVSDATTAIDVDPVQLL